MFHESETGTSLKQADVGVDDQVAHIVTKKDQMRGYIEGVPIQALCGKVWVPSQDFEGLPVCEVCARIRRETMVGRWN